MSDQEGVLGLQVCDLEVQGLDVAHHLEAQVGDHVVALVEQGGLGGGRWRGAAAACGRGWLGDRVGRGLDGGLALDELGEDVDGAVGEGGEGGVGEGVAGPPARGARLRLDPQQVAGAVLEELGVAVLVGGEGPGDAVVGGVWLGLEGLGAEDEELDDVDEVLGLGDHGEGVLVLGAEDGGGEDDGEVLGAHLVLLGVGDDLAEQVEEHDEQRAVGAGEAPHQHVQEAGAEGGLLDGVDGQEQIEEVERDEGDGELAQVLLEQAGDVVDVADLRHVDRLAAIHLELQLVDLGLDAAQPEDALLVEPVFVHMVQGVQQKLVELPTLIDELGNFKQRQPKNLVG